jgi:hypothetical protein
MLNVVLSLTVGEMPLEEYLAFHQYLNISDIETCVKYCAKQHCIDNRVITFCQGCSLDSRISEPCENPDFVDIGPDVEFDESSENEKINVWELADKLISELPM